MTEVLVAWDPSRATHPRTREALPFSQRKEASRSNCHVLQYQETGAPNTQVGLSKTEQVTIL